MKYTEQTEQTERSEPYLILEDYRRGLFKRGVRIRQEEMENEPKDHASAKLEAVNTLDRSDILDTSDRLDTSAPYYKCKKEKRMYRSLDVPGDPFEIESSGFDVLSKSAQFSLGETALVNFKGNLYCEESLQPLASITDNYHISTHITVEDGGILEVQGDVHLGKKATVMVHRGGRLVMQAGAMVAAGSTIEVQPGETKTVGAGLRPALEHL
ncbi:MAG: hypothetical protein LBM77_04355 [Spirochaetaceae bacterium]|jgi:hypothetical protein|nr:hypothetical protein [Spirochaetaceae bacterium]